MWGYASESEDGGETEPHSWEMRLRSGVTQPGSENGSRVNQSETKDGNRIFWSTGLLSRRDASPQNF